MRHRRRVQPLEHELEADQNPDRHHDRDQQVALFHLGSDRRGSGFAVGVPAIGRVAIGAAFLTQLIPASGGTGS